MTKMSRRLTRLTRLEAAKATRNDDLVAGDLLVFDHGAGHKRRWRGYDHALVIEALRPAEEATNG
jgi:phosphopentomutase